MEARTNAVRFRLTRSGLAEGHYAAEELEGGGDGEAHDVEEVALDAGDPAGGVTLDAVGTGFVEGVAGAEVVVELVGGDCGEEDVGGFDVGEAGGGSDDGDAGVDLMGVAGEGAEHALGVGEVDRLVEDLVVEDDGGVGAEDGGGGMEVVEGQGLLEGETLDVLGGGFVEAEGFVDVRGEDIEAEACLSEEIAATRGCGGED